MGRSSANIGPFFSRIPIPIGSMITPSRVERCAFTASKIGRSNALASAKYSSRVRAGSQVRWLWFFLPNTRWQFGHVHRTMRPLLLVPWFDAPRVRYGRVDCRLWSGNVSSPVLWTGVIRSRGEVRSSRRPVKAEVASSNLVGTAQQLAASSSPPGSHAQRETRCEFEPAGSHAQRAQTSSGRVAQLAERPPEKR